jgi:hypothetical protein
VAARTSDPLHTPSTFAPLSCWRATQRRSGASAAPVGW